MAFGVNWARPDTLTINSNTERRRRDELKGPKSLWNKDDAILPTKNW